MATPTTEPPAGRTLFWSAGLLAAALALSIQHARLSGESDRRPFIYLHLFARHDLPGAAAGLLALAAAALAARRIPTTFVDTAVAAVAARPLAAAGLATATCAAGALVVFRAFPLSMDEYACVFQAEVFASGRLWAAYPPDWVEWLFPPDTRSTFVMTSPASGRAAAWYWPVYAALLTPFTLLGVPWLLNPLLTGAAVWLLADTARRLTDDPAAAGWAVLFAVASPAFLVNGMTYYSMPAHLALNLLFGWLLLEPSPARLVLAGAAGSLALTLHNPLPHAAFALPWLAWLAWTPGRVRRLALVAAGYLPLAVVLGLGWPAVRAAVLGDAAATSASQRGALAVAADAFTGINATVIQVRMIGFAKLVAWAVPVLPVLAVTGAVAGRDRRGVRLWAASAAVTLAAYLPVIFEGGHGWGYRYFHSAWAALPLLGAVAVSRLRPRPGGDDLARLAFAAAALSLAVLVPLRAWQAGEFLREHLRQRPPVLDGPPGWPVVFQDTDMDRTYYANDLVQNPADLSRPPLVLTSHGPAADAAFARRLDPAAAEEWSDGRSSVWRVPTRPPVPRRP